MSQASQPSAVISAQLIGRNGAGLSACARFWGQELSGFAARAVVFMVLTNKTPGPQIQPIGRRKTGILHPVWRGQADNRPRKWLRRIKRICFARPKQTEQGA